MRRTWPWGIPHHDIELRIGSLQAFFSSRTDVQLVYLILTLAMTMATALVLMVTVMLGQAIALWYVSLALGAVTLTLLGVTIGRSLRRKYFAICSEGCAYGSSWKAEPKIMPWTDVKTIRLVENASLHTGEHAVMGLKLSTMKQEVTKHLLCFETQGEEVQVPLKDFPQYQALLDALVEQTQEQKFGLEYERQETDDLQAAKAAGEDQYFGKKRMTVAGIVLVVLFITIKILSVFLKK